MRIKIISDGKPTGTRIVNAETGERIEGVTGIKWSLGLKSLAECELRLINIAVEIVGEVGELVETTQIGDRFRSYLRTGTLEASPTDSVSRSLPKTTTSTPMPPVKPPREESLEQSFYQKIMSAISRLAWKGI